MVAAPDSKIALNKVPTCSLRIFLLVFSVVILRCWLGQAYLSAVRQSESFRVARLSFGSAGQPRIPLCRIALTSGR